MWQHDTTGSTATNARPLAPSSDAALVRAARTGSSRAFDEIVLRYDAKVRQLAVRLVDPSEVDDVAQTAFLSAFRALGSFEESASFSSWLYRIVWNAALMRLRSKRRRREVYMEDLPAFDAAADSTGSVAASARADVEIERRETSAVVDAAVDSLPHRYRNVVHLRHYRDLSTAEVGKRLGLTPATVKTRLHRARRGLRRTLAQVA